MKQRMNMGHKEGWVDVLFCPTVGPIFDGSRPGASL